ncbi:MAG: hypothetical protein Q7U77_11040 [Sediminibacterium sp.]|uniref:hypothetical protein n=1 Tax=Sediminibacterium sp. TaxID=1917865 RepID=UPI00272404E8|nr:hypothetical protein [Sediminibacterium sp.]MDO8997152.1 hypothetical protein [Sediminibacterium sp.]
MTNSTSDQKLGESSEITLKELLQKIGELFNYLKTQWIKIILVGFIGGSIGFLYAWKQPITYTAKLTFVVEEGKSGGSTLGGLASLAGQFGVDVGGSGGSGVLSSDNVLLYFKSESLTRDVLLSQYNKNTNQSFADIYATEYGFKKNWEKDKKIGKVFIQPSSHNEVYSRLEDSLIQSMAQIILKTQFNVLKADKKAGFIDVSTTMKNENLAKFFCEKIVQIAIDRYLNIKMQRQTTIVENLQKRVDSIANLLRQKTASGALLQTTASTMDINPLYRTGSAVAVESTIRDKSLLATIFATVLQNLELAKFTLSQETPVIQIIESPYFPLKRNKQSRLMMAIYFSIVTSSGYIIFILLKKIINF